MNKHFESYFLRALHDAKIQELTDSYRKRGFVIIEPDLTADQDFDLRVRDNETDATIAFEVKITPLTPDTVAQIEQLRQRARKLGYTFRLVVIAKPKKYAMSIDWFDNALGEYIMEHTLPSIEILVSHVLYEDIESDILSIAINGSKATVLAGGTVNVTLQYGSDSDLHNDDGLLLPRSFAYDGEFEVDIANQSIMNAQLTVDTNEWFA